MPLSGKKDFTITSTTAALGTISFFPDGTLSGKADCNTFSGTYSQQNGFKIGPGATTKVAYSEGSLEAQYLDLLNNIAAGGPDSAESLALETAGGPTVKP
jgi:heat shock protein HslJ